MPLDPEQAHLFDPETVPTVQSLLPQLPQSQLAEPRKVGAFSLFYLTHALSVFSRAGLEVLLVSVMGVSHALAVRCSHE